MLVHAACVAVLAAAPAAAAAGPYSTGDPTPVDQGHWSIYLSADASFDPRHLTGSVPQVEVNYGAASDLQLHLVAPVTLRVDPRSAPRYGPGDLEVGAKLRFVGEDVAGVAIGTAPTLTLPTGASASGLGEGTAKLLLPIWIQRSLGPFTAYGGAGYELRPGRDAFDKLFLGVLVEWSAGPVTVGAEVYRRARSIRSLTGQNGFNLGVLLDLTEVHHIAFSAGATEGSTRYLDAYLAWKLTLG